MKTEVTIYKSSNELLAILEKRAIHGEKLVVLRGSQWKEILEAYSSLLLHRVNKDALVFHPVKEVKTGKTSYLINDHV